MKLKKSESCVYSEIFKMSSKFHEKCTSRRPSLHAPNVCQIFRFILATNMGDLTNCCIDIHLMFQAL